MIVLSVRSTDDKPVGALCRWTKELQHLQKKAVYICDQHLKKYNFICTLKKRLIKKTAGSQLTGSGHRAPPTQTHSSSNIRITNCWQEEEEKWVEPQGGNRACRRRRSKQLIMAVM